MLWATFLSNPQAAPDYWYVNENTLTILGRKVGEIAFHDLSRLLV